VASNKKAIDFGPGDESPAVFRPGSAEEFAYPRGQSRLALGAELRLESCHCLAREASRSNPIPRVASGHHLLQQFLGTSLGLQRRAHLRSEVVDRWTGAATARKVDPRSLGAVLRPAVNQAVLVRTLAKGVPPQTSEMRDNDTNQRSAESALSFGR
jgi:hypothetical protein